MIYSAFHENIFLQSFLINSFPVYTMPNTLWFMLHHITVVIIENYQRKLYTLLYLAADPRQAEKGKRTDGDLNK